MQREHWKFFLTDTAEAADALHKYIQETHPAYLYYGACVDVVGSLPKLEMNIAICRCLLPTDRNTLLREINGCPNRIVVDLTNGNQRIDVMIRHPEFSQSVLQRLSKRLGPDKAFSQLTDALLQNRDALITRKSGFINYLVAGFMNKNYPQEMSELTIGINEMRELKNFFVTWGKQ